MLAPANSAWVCWLCWLCWCSGNYTVNHKNYNFLACDWFKNVLFSTNSLPKLLSDSLLLDVWVIDQVWGQGWILAKFFFCVFMDQGEVEVHKLAKKKTRPISSHLNWTNFANKGFIVWLLVKFCLRDTALHLARSGSQSQRAIWFILPARKASHIIKFVIGQFVIG